MKKIRCAIYTRKSAEEGLEQDFNSLDAQREACAAYVASQKAEGWVLLPTVYEDAGLSGGTLERPGLQRLLDDIDAGLVEQIVVYKVDRLTRCLADFAKLVERLEAAGAVFVSVTQSCAKTRPSRHRRKNCASRNQAKTLAREQVTRRPPTLDCGSTIWTRRERKRSRFYLNIGVARVTAFRVPHTATTANR